jgi:serpin B
MTHITRIIVVVALLGIVIVGLSPPNVQVLQSSLDRVLDPHVTDVELSSVVSGNTQFAFELYQTVRGTGGNLLFSPYSISLATAMVHAGARGETQRQLAQGMHFALPHDRLHLAFNALGLRLSAGDDAFELRIANALWGQTGYPFLQEFLDILAMHYGAGLRLAEFERDPERARDAINRWIARATNGRIPGALPEGSIAPDTRFVLCNAIYFNAEWAYKFARRLTHDEPFHLAGGETVRVPMMRHDESRWLRYARVDGCQAVELPYEGNAASMVILLPDAGQLDAFERELTSTRWHEITSALSSEDVILIMPKFRYAYRLSLVERLRELGIADVFDSAAADLSGIADKPLFLQSAVHQAFIDVNEERTEAAAVTAFVGAEAAIEQEPLRVVVDRPFLYAIRDQATSVILFLGRVMDPRENG